MYSMSKVFHKKQSRSRRLIIRDVSSLLESYGEMTRASQDITYLKDRVWAKIYKRIKPSIMQKLIAFFDGKKTYITAAIVAILVFLHQAGFIDQQAYETLLGLLGAAGLATLRLALKK